ncbi:MAG: S-layer homology domain-containing protein [Clostridia bacterium]|nr:S-layer homology domain-containing protein [Clostridia bacterium]
MKKVLSFTMALLMLLGIIASTACAESTLPFTDVKMTSWYAPAVLTVHSAGIMEGKGEGKFAPNASMTRAELVTVLYRMSGEILFGGADNLTFSDVKKNAWYAEAVAWAVSSELATGYPDNTFRPNNPILRQELAKMFVSFLDYMKITKKAAPLVDSFADSARFPDWAAEYIEALRETGLMGGDDAGNFKPKAKASRAEIATVITRLMPLMENEDEGNNDGGNNNNNNGNGGSTDFVPPPAPENFELCTEEKAPKPYYIRFPEGYSESSKYPLVIFTAGSGSVSINSVGAIFPSDNSPTHDSIVMIPAVSTNADLEGCNDVIEYVTKKYSADTERVYLLSTGENDGNFWTWKMLEKSPSVVSAVLYIHGGSSPVGGKSNGGYILEGMIIQHFSDELHVRRITDEALAVLQNLPIYYHHCTDQKEYTPNGYLYPNYGEMLEGGFEDAGMNKTVIVNDTGYPTIYDDFAVRNNGAAFDWLFAQKRETK